MKKIDIVQGSQDWHAWRNSGIGASEISILMGSNPYKTPLQLWEDKCGFGSPVFVNAAMQHGKDNEDQIRQKINADNLICLEPLCAEDETYPHFKASFDGYDETLGILHEIKCPSSEKIIYEAFVEGKYPDYWHDQVLWQLMICGLPSAYLSIWDHNTDRILNIEIRYDKDRIQKMISVASEFWQNVQMGNQPALQKGDFLEIDDRGLSSLLHEYLEESLKKKKIEINLKRLKALIELAGDDGSFICDGFKVVRIQPSASYDLKKMREDGVDIEKYKKISNSIGYYRIFPPKQ